MAGAPTALALGTVLGLTGAGFDSPSLLVAGLTLIALALSAVTWVELARPRRLVRGPAPTSVIEGEPYRLHLDPVGAHLPPPGGRLGDGALERPLELGPRRSLALRVELRLDGRGRRRLGAPWAEVRDPLGLWARRVEGDDAGELLVLPRIEPVLVAGRPAGAARGRDLIGLDDGAENGLAARAIELEVDGLRPYRPGTPASRIHWPAVARTGELLERRLVAGADAAPLVALDASRPASAAALDAAVRAAASLCVHLGARGGCAILLGHDRRPSEIEPDLRGWPQVHARLAVVEAGTPPPAVARTIRPGAVFWVTAAERPALPRALRGGAAPRYLVAPGRADPRAAAFTVAGCSGRIATSSPRRHPVGLR